MSIRATTRREVLKKAIVAGGIATAAPVVTSLQIPAAAQVGSVMSLSFQYTVSRQGGDSTTPVSTTLASPPCNPIGFMGNEPTSTNEATARLTRTTTRQGNTTRLSFTLPSTGSCTFSTAPTVVDNGSCVTGVVVSGTQAYVQWGLSNRQSETVRLAITC